LSYINFNNAGSSFGTSRTLKVIKKFLEFEVKVGGYYAEKLYEDKLNQFYINVSKLINSRTDEISFLQNSTYAWNFFLSSIKLKKDENVVILDNEYGSNHIGLINKKIKYQISKINDDGQFCPNDLVNKINKKTKIIFVCHIASQCGDEINVEKIGNIIKKINKNIIFVVDACQSIGQVKIDVKKQKCDVLVGSGRKYLRGPRGTGILYMNRQVKRLVCPSIVDIKNSFLEKNKILTKDKTRFFEVFEYSPALKLGLSEAIQNINNIGIDKIQKKIKKLSNFFLSEMKSFHQIDFYENPRFNIGINTFSIKGLKSSKIYDYLLKHKILTSVANYQTSPNYFKKKNIKSVLRVSFHYYNNFEEVSKLKKCLIDLIKKEVDI
tara:strand:- start:3796 stop:4935 length:1140 start_codon:yes stop_codon:yes gene_type:complete